MTLALFRDDAYRRDCTATVTAVTPAGIELDRTVFYPLGGGQPGDSGVLRRADGSTVAIVDTRRGEAPGAIVHLLAADAPPPAVGEAVHVHLDWARRHAHMRMHTCLHLLSAVIPAGVTGGAVAADKGRLDFDLPDTLLDRDAVGAALNALIAADHPVGTRWITDAELDASPELVKTLSVQPPRGHGRVRLVEIAGIDLQPCGGTHVARTGEIGRVVVTKIEKKSTHNRRVILAFADGA
ncbi:misacylated tRNA(Ala) deacylase [Plasticicumulans lactativorans]|uniref:Alanine--tRNA ligase n=1 Tax=Plasticicumulans lactativorans TaxID=1133106 RepID=A0A4R2L3F4_9GAMM|nr:alanyl-tRNA editing protein [Plasticicumulans lactativorans]TCO79757.1 misacylated tRNA(Ala) deacylase [Plasticicumulans lactativorans]